MRQHRSKGARWLPALLLLMLAAASLTGCNLQSDKTMAITGDWSRGLRLGIANIREPLAMDVDTDVYLAWPQKGDAGIGVHYARVSSAGKVLADRAVDTDLFFPRSFQLVRDPQGQTHLFVRASIHSGERTNIFHLLLGADGNLLAPPEALAPPEHDVEAYDIAMYSDGDMALVWESLHPNGQGVYQGLLSGAVKPMADLTLIAPNGISPAIAVDGTDTLHLIWVIEPRAKERYVHYAACQDRIHPSRDSVVVAEYSGGTGTIFTSQTIGVDDGHVYAFWSTEFRAGMEQGSGTSQYVAFPKGKPDLITPRQVRLPPTGDLTYSDADLWIRQLWSEKKAPFDGSAAATPPQADFLNYSQIYGLPPGGDTYSSRYVAYPAPINTDHDELAVMFSVFTEHRMQEDVQPGMAIFIDGVLVGYQLVARTVNYSWHNTALANASGDLYALWSDTSGEGNYDIYLATTEPELRASINRMSIKDFTLGVINVTWGMLSGLTLAPLVIIVMFLPLLWIGMVYIFGSDDSLAETGPRVAFVIATILYYAGKLVLFSTVLAYPPMTAAVPAQLQPIVWIGLPVLILALAFVALAIYARRSGYPRLFVGFFVFALSDALFTMLFYGPGFFG